jgi:hypothetical protein
MMMVKQINAWTNLFSTEVEIPEFISLVQRREEDCKSSNEMNPNQLLVGEKIASGVYRR